jgi:hypothetical protein
MIAESFGKRNDLGPVSAGAAIIHAGLVILSVMGPSLGAVRAEVAERTSAQVREGAAAAGGGTAPSVVRIVRDRYGVPHIFAASPHYADQMPLFAARQFKRALLTRTEIEAAATSTKILPYPGEQAPCVGLRPRADLPGFAGCVTRTVGAGATNRMG